jgi:hypothetical protein
MVQNGQCRFNNHSPHRRWLPGAAVVVSSIIKLAAPRPLHPDHVLYRIDHGAEFRMRSTQIKAAQIPRGGLFLGNQIHSQSKHHRTRITYKSIDCNNS